MAALGITLPITSRIIVRNLAYGVNETKLREVFSMSGQMIEATLHRYDDGETKGTAAIEYAHPLGAVQAMMIFRDSKLFSRKLIIEQDKIGPQPSITGRLPDGLTDVKDGIGLNGSRLKIEYINGDAIIHHPDCHNQGSHPITEEERESHIKDGNLGERSD
jgi:RNA recognition motif-containing protein